MYVGEGAEHAPYHLGVHSPAIDWRGVPSGVGDHVRVMHGVHPGKIAGVEGVVALLNLLRRSQ